MNAVKVRCRLWGFVD